MEGKYLTTLFLVLIVVLTLLLAVALALLTWLIFKLRSEKATSAPSSLKPQLVKDDAGPPCPNHPDKVASGKCAICEKNFCSKCLFSQEGPTFCRAHMNLYLCTTWVELGEVKTTAMTPNEAAHLYAIKKELLKSGDIPAFIVTNYKINTESDTIESYVSLSVPQSNKEEISKRINLSRQQ